MPAYTFPRVASPTPHIPSLLEFLSTNPPLSELISALEEFAWRSITDGKRVRKWCAEISALIESVPPETASSLREALQSTTLSTLFPLVNATPLPLVPASSWLNLSRKQLVDVLSRLSRDRSVEHASLREQVLEVCLEYVGRRWRGDGEDMVGDIARKLTEIEFELQLQGDPITVRSVFLPIIHSLRFSLGLVSPSQLTTRINSIRNPTVRQNVSFDPDQLVRAWLVTRLRSGAEPGELVEDLLSARDSLMDHDKEIITAVLSDFALKRQRDTSDSILGHGVVSPSQVTPRKKPSLTVKAPSPKWWTHRRNNSSTSKLHLAPLFNPDRRPSLPVISSPSFLSSNASFSRPALAYQSSSSLGTVNPRLSTSSRETTQDLLASLMTFEKPEDIRMIVLDRLLGMRYKIGFDSEADWYLGQGKLAADEVMSTLELRLVGKKDVMGLKSTFDGLRELFALPLSLKPVSVYKPKHRSIETVVDQFPVVPLRHSILSSASEAAEPAASHRRSISTINYAERDASFDLDQYISDITPLQSETTGSFGEPNSAKSDTRRLKRRSAGAESAFTMTTMFSDLAHRASILSSFTIREARREDPAQGMTAATSFNLPRRVISLGDIEVGSAESSSHDHWSIRQGSVSEPDLLEMLTTYEPYTDEEDLRRPRHSLRRVSRYKGRLGSHISAYDLDLVHALPTISPTVPTYHWDPPSIPTVPPVPSIPDSPSISRMESIPSLSSGSSAAVRKNLAGLDTPPASPPIIDSSTITFTLTDVSRTPPGKSTKREFAIFDGEHVSPPRDCPSSPASTYASIDDDESSSVADTTPNTPRIGSLRTVKPLNLDQQLRNHPSLRSIMELFEIRDDTMVLRTGVSDAAVNDILNRIVEGSAVDLMTKRWLLSQLHILLGEEYESPINLHLGTLAIAPLQDTTPPRPSALRHHTYPSNASDACPITPLCSSPVDTLSKVKHPRATSSFSATSARSYISTHTFGTPGQA